MCLFFFFHLLLVTTEGSYLFLLAVLWDVSLLHLCKIIFLLEIWVLFFLVLLHEFAKNMLIDSFSLFLFSSFCGIIFRSNCFSFPENLIGR